MEEKKKHAILFAAFVSNYPAFEDFWSMSTKLALALSIIIAFPLLEIFGFSLNTAENSNNVGALSVIYSIVPVVLKIISILIIWHHPLTATRQSVIKRQILRREKRMIRNVDK